MQDAGQVMVWAGIWGDKIIGPIFINRNLNANKYLNMLQKEIFPSLLSENSNFPARLCPALTPLDFYLWGHLKAMVYQENIRDINHLKDRIINSFAQISPDVLLRVHSEWVKRIKMCIQNNSGHIEPAI